LALLLDFQQRAPFCGLSATIGRFNRSACLGQVRAEGLLLSLLLVTRLFKLGLKLSCPRSGCGVSSPLRLEFGTRLVGPLVRRCQFASQLLRGCDRIRRHSRCIRELLADSLLLGVSRDTVEIDT
jgi:hypothetical protein